MTNHNEVQNVPSVLTDDEIDSAQEQAYKDLVAKGFSGGMCGFQWDRASARAIEQAIIAKYAAAPLTVSLSPDPRGVHVAVHQGSECVHVEAMEVPAALEIPEAIRTMAARIAADDFKHCTSDPIFTVQKRTLLSGLDTDYCEDIGWFHDGNQVMGEEAVALEAEYEDTTTVPEGYTRTGIQETWEHFATYITPEAAQEFACKKGDQYRAYVDSGCRNHEWKALRAFLLSIATQPATLALPGALGQGVPDTEKLAHAVTVFDKLWVDGGTRTECIHAAVLAIAAHPTPPAGEGQQAAPSDAELDAIWREGALREGCDPSIRGQFRWAARALLARYAAPQAAQGDTSDLQTVIGFIFDRFGEPEQAVELPEAVVQAVRRLEASQPDTSELSERGDAIKAAYLREFGSDAGWFGSGGSYFTEGYIAAHNDQPAQDERQPVYQIKRAGDSDATWCDASLDAYELTAPDNRRILSRAALSTPPTGADDDDSTNLQIECAMSLVLHQTGAGTYYMDIPDGGNVLASEQVLRMGLDAKRYRAWRDAAVSNNDAFARALKAALPPEAREGKPRWPTADEWDAAVDAAIASMGKGPTCEN